MKEMIDKARNQVFAYRCEAAFWAAGAVGPVFLETRIYRSAFDGNVLMIVLFVLLIGVVLFCLAAAVSSLVTAAKFSQLIKERLEKW